MDSTANCLGTSQLCRGPDRASSTARGHQGTGIMADGTWNVPRFDRVRASRTAGTLSNSGVSDRYISRSCILLASYPISRLRRDRASWIAVVAGRDEGHLTVWIGLCVGLCGAKRHGLKLTLTLTCAARQCQTRSQKQSKKRKREAKLFQTPS